MPDKNAEYTRGRGVEPCSKDIQGEQKMEPDSLLAMTRPDPSYSILTIREDSWLEDPNSWGVTLIGWGQTYRFTLADPFQTIDESELTWYVERFALRNPFDIARAGKVQSQLREYAIHFVAIIETAIAKVSEGFGSCDVLGTISALCLQILSAKAESKFNKIPWELLEDMSLWANFKVPILICRQINTPQKSLQVAKKERINILFVSARPSYEIDVPYRVISKPVFEMAEGLETVQVDFLRPATWKKFQKLLDEREGYFDAVHFDLHGKIESGVPFLYFSPGGGIRPERTKIRASLVAGIIAKAKVGKVILNACKSAQTQNSEVTNMAIQFVRAGAQNAIGMSFSATVELASIFMVAFYEAYLVKRLELESAVLLGRAKLRTFKRRKARFAVQVEVNDAFVPILAQRYSDSSDIPVPILSMPESSDRAQQPRSPKSSLSILGRDTDLVQLEEDFSVSKIVLLTGMRGAGKTAFGKYVAEWWEKSHFVDRSIFCSFLSYQNDLTKFYEDFSVSDNPPPTTSTRRHPRDAFHACRYLVVLDDCNPEIAPGHQSTSWDLVDSHFRKFLDGFQSEHSKCLLLMISDTARAERWIKRAPFKHHRISELTQTDASDIAGQLLDQPNFNPKWETEDLEALEDLIHYHEKNPLFLAIFLPLLEASGHRPTRFLEQLYLTLPEGTCERIGVELQKTYVNPVNSLLLLEFKQHLAALIVEMANGIRSRYTWILALSPFQKQFPQGYLTWIFKLQEWPVTKSETDSVEEFLSWLKSMGLILKDNDLDREARHMDELFFKMHPLLPYLLRYVLEAWSPDRPEILRTYKTFQKLFWSFYETRLSRVTGNRAYQNARCAAYSRDIENIINAIVVSMEQEVFGKQVVHTIEAILFHPEIRPLLSERQTRRLYRVLKECSIRYHTMCSDTMPKDVLEQAFNIIDFIEFHPSGDGPSSHSHTNIKRGERLLQVARSRFPDNDFTVACEMWCKVHELIAHGRLIAGHYDVVRDMALKSAPCDDQLWKDVFTVSQMRMFIFVAHELPSAAFPVEPFEVLIAQYTAKIETTFLNSFGDPQLCKAAISVYTTLIALGGQSHAIAKALTDLEGSKFIYMFPEARRYLASEWIPEMEPRKELDVLENALEISLENHDRGTEFFVRDTLLRMRVESEEIEAVVQHNERLRALEHEIQATSFEPSSRGRIGERYLLAGTFYYHFINESTSRQPDLELKARGCFEESLKYLEMLPGFGEAKFYVNYNLSLLYRKAGMHKESLQHAAAIVQLERGQEKEDLPKPRHSFEKGEFLWHYGNFWTSVVWADEGQAIQSDLDDAVARKIGWYPAYLEELMILCLKAIQHFEWYKDECFDGTWATCSGPLKKFLWGAQELLFASNARLAQQTIWPVSRKRRPSPEELNAWLNCVVEGPAEDVLDRLVDVTSQRPRLAPEENEGT